MLQDLTPDNCSRTLLQCLAPMPSTVPCSRALFQGLAPGPCSRTLLQSQQAPGSGSRTRFQSAIPSPCRCSSGGSPLSNAAPHRSLFLLIYSRASGERRGRMQTLAPACSAGRPTSRRPPPCRHALTPSRALSTQQAAQAGSRTSDQLAPRSSASERGAGVDQRQAQGVSFC